MAQLVKHSIRQNGLLWLQHLPAISLSSASAGNLIHESSERSSSSWQVWLPCKTLSCQASIEKSQETENSVEIKLEAINKSNHRKVCSKAFRGHTIKENVGRPSYQKVSGGATSLQCMEVKGAISEEQGTLETGTIAAGCNVETSAAGLPIREGKKVVTESVKRLLELNSNNSANVLDTASTTSQSKKDWVQVLSKYRDSQNGQNISNRAAPESHLPCVEPKEQENLKFSAEIEKILADPRFTVCIEQDSIDVDVSVITELLSSYGGIEGSFRRMRVDGIWSTFVNFKTEEAKENALAARWLHIDGKQLAIRRVDQLLTTVVRISNASPEVTDNKVLYKCDVWGRVDNVKRRGNGMFDVYFKAKELPNMSTILDSLNSTTLNHKQWKALPAPLVHPEAVEDLLKKGGLPWCHSQQLGVVDRIEAAIDNLMVDLQDLRELCDLGG